MEQTLALLLLGLGAAGSASTSAKAAEVTGAGATFVYPIMSKWSGRLQRRIATYIWVGDIREAPRRA